MSKILVGVVVLSAAIGCGGSGHPKPAAVPSPAHSATPSPTPSPTVLTLAEARATYVRIVAATNRDFKELNVLTASSGDWPLAKIRRWARRARTDTHSEAIALRATLWPANVVPVARKMADGDAAVIPSLTNLATDTTQLSAAQDWNAAATATRTPANFGEQMRELLGLPSAS